ncbi:HEAT repeat-containing protein 1 [Gouania willdenowi]|uniref:HEAT repeat-containing protein 1 n=1 Tax=Gouania willdenowi TaxID=441366 RepID=UPI001054796C|nr:HEAT repeat-containing protein 1 [Gouania willdenowi]
MSSLALQLKRLALPQSTSHLCRDNASLLFDPKDAATMARSTFYDIGCTGLEELLGIEPLFLEFQDTLFSQSSLTLERSVHSKEVNDKLDAGIRLFLSRLCPYFLLKPAQKCLEWLIHRFHIQLYNTDSLMACALPYHDTKVFVRVLQLLNIKDTSSRWNWLYPLQKPGVPLSRGALITHCYSDLSFMDFLCSSVTHSVEAYSGVWGSCSQLRVVFSFYASTLVSALDAVDRVSDALVSKLLPYIQRGLNSSLMDYRAASYMLVCQLAVKVVLEAMLVDVLICQVSKSLLKEPVLVQEGLGCLTVLLQSQEGVVGPRAVPILCSVPTLASTLRDMASVHDVSPVLRYLLPYLVHHQFTTDPGETPSEQVNTLHAILELVPLNKDLDQDTGRWFLDQYLAQSEPSEETLSVLDEHLRPLIRLLESRYCGALDRVLQGHVTGGSAQRRRLFHRFLCLTTSSGKHQILGDSDTSLLLSLNHPQPSVRLSAVQHLNDLVTSAQQHSLDGAFLKDAVLQRVKDEEPAVVNAAISALQTLLDTLDPEDVMMCLLTLLHKADVPNNDRWLPALTEAVHLLSDPRLGNADAELEQKAFWKLLPFLVVTSVRPNVSVCVARCSVIARHPLTWKWAEELELLMKTSDEPDFIGSVNERLVVRLTENLKEMDLFSRRHAMENLALLVEEQRSSALRQRAAFLVLSHTLALGLRQLSSTHHLMSAQRLYALMERPLMELGGVEHHTGQVCVGSASFPEALTLYLSRCDDGHFSSVLMFLLRDFISALSCDHAPFKGEQWWNLEKMDSNSCCYLVLLSRLFSVLMVHSQGPTANHSRDLMKLLVQVHLPDAPTLIRLLCVLWGWDGYHGDHQELKVDAVLQTRALIVGRELLNAQTCETLTELINNTPVFPCLLCCLSSSVRDVRRAGLHVLQSLSGASSSPFQPITERLLRNQEEIEADPSYLSTALGALHAEPHRKAQASLQQLLKSVVNPSCPSYTATALLETLRHVSGQDVLAAVLPLLDVLLQLGSLDSPASLPSEARLLRLVLRKFDDASAPLLKEQSCLELFLRAVKTQSSQLTALEQITKAFFSALGDEKVQQQLLTVLFDLLKESRDPLLSNTVSSVFKRISVDGRLVANELAPPEKSKVCATVQQTRRSRLTQRKAQEEAAPDGGAVPWRRVTLILELLQHKKKLQNIQTLVPVLFTLLQRSMEPCSDDLTNMEYTKQLLLGGLFNICQRLSAEGRAIAADILDEEKFSVELVVQCVRTSDVPQTHHHALLLLGAVAAIFPDKVLHNIMPIFTFMGANILRLDDAYSFRVIERTLQTVVPALIEAQQRADGSSPDHVVAVVTRIMHVFADALPHVPVHRRLPVLTQLVTTLGPERFLWVLMLLLFKLHALQSTGSASEKDAALEADVDFWVSLCAHFDVGDILHTLVHFLSFLLHLPEDKDNAPPQRPPGRRAVRKEEESAEELIFSVETHTDKELRHFKFLCVSFMASLLGSAHFIEKVADANDLELQPLQQRLLEEILRFIHRVAHCVDDNAAKLTAKFWRVLLNKAYDVLDKVNALLPSDSFIAVSRGLMGNELPSVRRKAMELLNNRLHHRTQWEEQQVTVLLQLADDLLGIVGKCHGEVTEEGAEPAINRQTALYSLKLLCRRFGSAHQEAFVPVLQRAVVIVESDDDKNVTGSALLCVAEVVGALKALAIPQLPRLMPALLHTLADRKELLTNEIYLLSTVTALQRITETLPHFISPYLQDTTSQVCRLSRLLESSSSSSSSSSSQLRLSLASLRSSLASQLPPRVLLPTVSRTYSRLVPEGRDQVGALMSILKEHIGHMDKEQLSFHQSELTSLFLTALDFRAQHGQADLEEAGLVEGEIIDCLVVMVMKLSEVTFRPLFFKLCDWSKSSSSDRLLTFFRLCDVVSDRLRGIFSLFAGNLIKPLVDVLNRTNTSQSEECGGGVLFDGDEDKLCLLLRFVLDCMQKLFLHDTHHFLNRERADALLSPLVDQLENRVGGEVSYRQRVTQHLVPCVAQFSAAAANDTLWKNLNYQILLKTRSSDSQVRFSSLLVLLGVVAKLKENYVVLLPETVPFLAELMEDECEEVEQQVQKVIQEMEKILGEPLQSYF